MDQTEKGWYIQYIDRDPETIRRQAEKERKTKMDMDDQERTQRFIDQQIVKAASTQKAVKEVEYTDLKREDEEEKVTFSLGGTMKKTEKVHSTV